MYSNKENVNILTALLAQHGVSHAVVCPGSRNAPIVHNLNEHPEIQCHPVTDERSAGFYALGMAQAGMTGFFRERVAVCVTSGSALLNLLPAVAEAYYQHLPLIVISADRPPQWIGQQDGQTIPQPDALGRFVRKAVTLPEPRNEKERWYCNRLVNEALIASNKHGCGPVHINVPISEPLYEFTVARLPEERKIHFEQSMGVRKEDGAILRDRLSKAGRPLVVVGQMNSLVLRGFRTGSTTSERHGFMLCEPLSCRLSSALDEVLEAIGDDRCFAPDFILYTGGHIVSKRLKQFLRKHSDVETWAVSEDGEVYDTFMHVDRIIEGSLFPEDLIIAEDDMFQEPSGKETGFYKLWADMFEKVRRELHKQPLDYSAEAVVRCFCEQDQVSYCHYANSTAVRLGCRYSSSFFYCNRGVNGIEGTLSTAAGMSLVSDEKVCCVIGDLSFFYDSNALWNAELRGNLRILLLNNGGGAIFERFEGLKESAAREMIMGTHHTHAEGICRQYRVGYRRACNMKEAEEGIDWLLRNEEPVNAPLLLEVMF